VGYLEQRREGRQRYARGAERRGLGWGTRSKDEGADRESRDLFGRARLSMQRSSIFDSPLGRTNANQTPSTPAREIGTPHRPDQKDTELAESEQQVQTLAVVCSSLQRKVAKSERRFQESEARCRALEEFVRSEVKALRDEATSKRTEGAELGQIQTIGSVCNSLQATVVSLKGRLDTVCATQAKAEADLMASESRARQSRETLELEAGQAAGQHQALQTAVASLGARVEGLQAAHREASGRLDRLNAAQDDCAEALKTDASVCAALQTTTGSLIGRLDTVCAVQSQAEERIFVNEARTKADEARMREMWHKLESVHQADVAGFRSELMASEKGLRHKVGEVAAELVASEARTRQGWQVLEAAQQKGAAKTAALQASAAELGVQLEALRAAQNEQRATMQGRCDLLSRAQGEQQRSLQAELAAMVAGSIEQQRGLCSQISADVQRLDAKVRSLCSTCPATRR
jgi:chromosome segregation ATPase